MVLKTDKDYSSHENTRGVLYEIITKISKAQPIQQHFSGFLNPAETD